MQLAESNVTNLWSRNNKVYQPISHESMIVTPERKTICKPIITYSSILRKAASFFAQIFSIIAYTNKSSPELSQKTDKSILRSKYQICGILKVVLTSKQQSTSESTFPTSLKFRKPDNLSSKILKLASSEKATEKKELWMQLKSARYMQKLQKLLNQLKDTILFPS